MSFPRLPPSGLKVVVVGAGFGGLAAAIECDRKGHSVVVLEKFAELKPLGDIISFGQNSTRMFAKWPGVLDAMEPVIHRTDVLHYHDWTGRPVTTQSFSDEQRAWGRRINGHRAELHQIVYEHARARGIDIRLGHQVTGYFEDGERAGVEVGDQKIVGDVVLVAEGVKSPGRKTVLGFDDRPQPSGYAVFRAWFASDALAADPLTRHLVADGDTHHAWIGRDVHFIVATIKGGAETSWVCTHRDDSDIDESWQFPGKVEDVLACIDDSWDPVARAVVRATPPGRLFDYKLVFRDPLPAFVSPRGRVVLVGDAAHPFLPTSIQGASQSMEDGAVMAACLDVAARHGHRVVDATRVYEAIRYDRVHRVQATGVSTRDGWHKADWDAIWKDPDSLQLKREEWILNFDAEDDAYAQYDGVRERLEAEGKMETT